MNTNISYENVDVSLETRSYTIKIGPGLIANAAHEIAECTQSRDIRIVTDQNVADHYLASLQNNLTENNFVVRKTIVLPPGEATKNLSEFSNLLENLLQSRIERGTVLIALGGGVIGDITGFAAAVLLRGLDFIQLPTTLLSQVDSSVGGKTGINSAFGKNLIGAFHQPLLVLSDTEVLQTLPLRELISGYAEIVKHALILDAGFFQFLEENGEQIIAGNSLLQAQAIRRSCEIKAEIVSRDELEKHDRALLNFGHTFGHAIEAATGYGKLVTHGEAVALGSIMALDLSVELGLCPSVDRDRVIIHYEKIGLPVRHDKSWNLDAAHFLDLMRTDKKNHSGRITLILSRGIGHAFTDDTIPETLLSDYLKTIFA